MEEGQAGEKTGDRPRPGMGSGLSRASEDGSGALL